MLIYLQRKGFPVFNFEERRDRNFLFPSRKTPWQSPENIHGHFLQSSCQFITSSLKPIRRYKKIQLKEMSLKKELNVTILGKLCRQFSWYDIIIL